MNWKTSLALLVFLNVVLSCFADHEGGGEKFSTNATIYACKPDGTECGWYAAKVIFLHCTEQVYIDPLTLVKDTHVYCREPRYIIPEDFAKVMICNPTTNTIPLTRNQTMKPCADINGIDRQVI